MGEYLGAVVVTSAVLGLLSYISYPSESEKTVKFAASVLLLYTALTPLLSFAGRVVEGGYESLEDIIEDLGGVSYESDEEYKAVAEQAFKEGIFKLLSTKYSVSEESADVFVYGFDFQEMRAEKIKILLYGNGVTADFRAIENYITESGLGFCEVNVRIG